MRYRLLLAVATTCSIAIACGGGDGDGGKDPGGSAAGESAQGGEETGGKGFAGEGSGGKSGSGTGGTQSAAGSSNGGGASNEGGSGPDTSELTDEGKNALDGEDGITGVASGETFTRTKNLKAEHITDGYLKLYADDGQNGDWELHIPAQVGVYGCESLPGEANARVSLNNRATSPIRGVTTSSLGGECTLQVASITPTIEGRFVASLVGVLGAIHPVTAGYFHFSDSPVGDCSAAEDPGVPEGTMAATFSVTNLEPQNTKGWKCGENGTFAQTYGVGGAAPYLAFAGELGVGKRELTLYGLKSTGTFECGTDGVKLTSGATWGGDNGGSCTITVTQHDADVIVGTYEAALWNGITAGHSTLHIAGSFRAKPSTL